MRNDFLQHGAPWKHHKYIRKEGKKYIYKETKKDDYGTTWDVYVNEETGEAVQKNTGFKYEPKRYTTKDFVEDAKRDLNENERVDFDELASEGEDIINNMFKKKKG